MIRTISKYNRRYVRTIFNSAIHPCTIFNSAISETGRWRIDNFQYQFRHNNRIPKSDCPIKTISRRGKLVTMSSVRDWSKQIDFCMSDQKFDY